MERLAFPASSCGMLESHKDRKYSIRHFDGVYFKGRLNNREDSWEEVMMDCLHLVLQMFGTTNCVVDLARKDEHRLGQEPRELYTVAQRVNITNERRHARTMNCLWTTHQIEIPLKTARDLSGSSQSANFGNS